MRHASRVAKEDLVWKKGQEEQNLYQPPLALQRKELLQRQKKPVTTNRYQRDICYLKIQIVIDSLLLFPLLF